MDEAASGRTRDSVLQRNRLAQRKFRVRQKERMKSTKEQLEAMTAEMNQLRMEKSQLETRTRILEQVVKLNTVHEARLHATSEIMSREQELLLEELATFVDLVDGKPAGTHRTADAKQWTMHEVMESIFPRYIDKLKALLSQSGEQESSPAYGELNHLVNTRREHEKRRALFSCFYWAVYSWNLHEMRAAQSPPTTAAWSIILNQLQLTEAQELGLLRAQQHLITRLQAVGMERSHILSAVGLELLQTSQGAWHLCSSVQQLQRNFGQEREAVFQFLFTFCDEMLTAQQEARLEAASFPWCPDFWEMTNLLAAKHKQAPPPLLLGLEVTGPALLPLLPLNTAFQFLVKPLMTRGLGMRLKRGIAIDPFETVVPASAFPIASIEQLRPMSLHDVHCGGYREQMFWTWAKTNLPNYIQIPC
ncbi:hypothetical protein WJX74_008215 [Apatococcus lobatus]|uniref:BZIP domain-containing protein n=1 Tax=Apatococcus lobatus TaxID=904363 RepID=A0AAW1Q916_9CHLO